MSNRSRPVTYELHPRPGGGKTIKRVEVIGEFPSRSLARDFMLATEASRKARDECPHREQRRDEHDVWTCLSCGAFSHRRSLESVLEAGEEAGDDR